MIGDQAAHNRGLVLFLTIIIGLAFVGFFVGTQSEHEAQGLSQFDATNKLQVQGVSARTYKELMEDPFAANLQWLDAIVDLQNETTPDVMNPVAPATPEHRELALRAREERRAYAGAPPVVPHQVTQADDLACVACHTQGVKIQQKTASGMSHPFMTNCTQCHVPADGPMKMIQLDHSVSTESAFVGLTEPTKGQRASAEAPPTIPHQTHMRETCMSCHGLNGQHGLRTTHPSRQSCTQCHAPSAEFDQRPMVPGLAPVGVP